MVAQALHKTAVVIPALNESAVIAGVIKRISKLGVGEIILVDDASTDTTCLIAEAEGVTVIKLFEPLGAWGATQTGLRYAVRKGFRFVVTLDADGQHNPDDIPRLLDPVATGCANVVIGSCTERGSRMRKVAWRWIKNASGVRLEDITSGFRVYDRLALRRVASWKATLLDYQDIGVILLLQRTGMVIQDVGVTMTERVNGKSRIFHNWGIVTYYMAHTLLLGFCKRIEIRRNPSPVVISRVKP